MRGHEEKRNERRPIVILRVLLLLIGSAVFLFSAWKLYGILREYKKADVLYADMKTEYAAKRGGGQSAYGESGSGNAQGDDGKGTEVAFPEKPSSADDSYEMHEHLQKLSLFTVELDYILLPAYAFDFDSLQEMNPDVLGWIRIEDTSIDYPFVQGEDNSRYLRTGADGQPLNAGSIFVDCSIADPFETGNTILYGHNQRNKKMFHALSYYLDPSYAGEHPLIEIYHADGTYAVYRVFAAYETECDSDVYGIGFTCGTGEFSEYLAACFARGCTPDAVCPSGNQPVITLSTCTDRYDDMRIVVQAELLYRK